MKRLLYVSSTLLLVISILFIKPRTVLASEGEVDHLEAQVSGYLVTLSSQSEWVKGENTLVVTLADEMGMPVSDAEVEILIAPKSDGHAEAESDSHDTEPEENSMPGMDMGGHAAETPSEPAHDEETADPLGMVESEHGAYIVETHFESSGQHEIQVFFHVNGEMFQVDFLVEIPGVASKTIVLWSFVVVNLGLVTFAGVLKKQTVTVKGNR